LFVDRSSNGSPRVPKLSANFNFMSFRTSVKCYELDRVSVVGQQQKANRVESNNLRQQTAQTLQDSFQVGLRCDGAGHLEQGPIPAIRCASRFHLANRHIQKGCLLEGHDTFRGSIPSFFMREIRVVRLIPMRAAAPFGPATRPFVIFSTRTASSRSLASRVPATGVVLPLLLSSPAGSRWEYPRPHQGRASPGRPVRGGRSSVQSRL